MLLISLCYWSQWLTCQLPSMSTTLSYSLNIVLYTSDNVLALVAGITTKRCPMRLKSFRGNQLNDMSCQCIRSSSLGTYMIKLSPSKGYRQQKNVHKVFVTFKSSFFEATKNFLGHKLILWTSHLKMLCIICWLRLCNIYSARISISIKLVRRLSPSFGQSIVRRKTKTPRVLSN